MIFLISQCEFEDDEGLGLGGVISGLGISMSLTRFYLPFW